MSLKGKTAVITGSNPGIGLGIAGEHGGAEFFLCAVADDRITDATMVDGGWTTR
ncbi:hypothetical protein [Sedimenticola hydrogenitrophicus]|uniref:hypothetical protein n=1 Tax=Sedimenticola hydrogenitrophicus TaxID=2967975 RepID=UPI0023AE78A0|nr:hypothetical protein [Sedimenticola hydrogenitrophicus]